MGIGPVFINQLLDIFNASSKTRAVLFGLCVLAA